MGSSRERVSSPGDYRAGKSLPWISVQASMASTGAISFSQPSVSRKSIAATCGSYNAIQWIGAAAASVVAAVQLQP